MKKFKEQCYALTKRFKSYFSSSRDFEDYPSVVGENRNAQSEDVRFYAQIVNWWGLVGHGETADKAIEQLRERFYLAKAHKKTLPRPGEYVPLQFATTEQTQKYEDLARDYLYRMFKINYDEGFFSDESLLEFFAPSVDTPDEAKHRTISRTLLYYNVDISDIYHEPLWRTLERIANSRHPT